MVQPIESMQKTKNHLHRNQKILQNKKKSKSANKNFIEILKKELTTQ